jgi:hypothetical protein
MARKSPEGSVSGWFRKVYEADHELLKHTTNEPVLERWRAEHPGQEVTQTVRGAQANIKSLLRKKFKIGGYKKGKGGRKPRAAIAPPGARVARTPARASRSAHLEQLEFHIDKCLTMARSQREEHVQDEAGSHLEEAVKYLRAARNRVVMALG